MPYAFVTMLSDELKFPQRSLSAMAKPPSPKTGKGGVFNNVFSVDRDHDVMILRMNHQISVNPIHFIKIGII